jgi:hypothetical protein
MEISIRSFATLKPVSFATMLQATFFALFIVAPDYHF